MNIHVYIVDGPYKGETIGVDAIHEDSGRFDMYDPMVEMNVLGVLEAQDINTPCNKRTYTITKHDKGYSARCGSDK